MGHLLLVVRETRRKQGRSLSRRLHDRAAARFDGTRVFLHHLPVLERETPMVLGKCELVAFAATARPDEARTFYRDVLGLRLVEDFEFALVFDANGTMLRIAKVDVVAPSANTVLGWAVPDLAAVMGALAAKGIAFEWFPGLNDPETGIWMTGRGDKVVWFTDPDGNLLSLTEFA